MKNSKNFVTLYLECPNYCLVKDGGQIPYNMGKYENVVGELVSTSLSNNELYYNEVEGLRIHSIKRILHNDTITGIIYLIKNSKKIDVLNLFHCRKNTYIFSKMYKWLNRNGKVYVKLDAGFKTIEDLENNEKYKRLFIKIVNFVDLTSAEAKVACEKLEKISNKKIYCIPNGTHVEKICRTVQQENCFVTVGRIGAIEKNSELLLEAFGIISDQCDWNLKFVGNCEKTFLEYYHNFINRRPELYDRVILRGQVTNRDELFLEYQSSKVFVLPSKFENFSLACVEAIVNGCYLVLSDTVTPYMDFTNYLKFGRVCKVDDKNDLAEKMLEAIKVVEQSSLSDEISQYGKNNFSWDVICKKIYEELKLG